MGAVLLDVDRGTDVTKGIAYFVTLRIRLRTINIFNRHSRITYFLALTY